MMVMVRIFHYLNENNPKNDGDFRRLISDDPNYVTNKQKVM